MLFVTCFAPESAPWDVVTGSVADRFPPHLPKLQIYILKSRYSPQGREYLLMCVGGGGGSVGPPQKPLPAHSLLSSSQYIRHPTSVPPAAHWPRRLYPPMADGWSRPPPRERHDTPRPVSPNLSNLRGSQLTQNEPPSHLKTSNVLRFCLPGLSWCPSPPPPPRGSPYLPRVMCKLRGGL